MSQHDKKRLYVVLAITAAIGLALRMIYGFVVIDWHGTPGDGVWYHAMANLLANGHGYVDPLLYPVGKVQPTAYHPPLYPVLLSGLSALGLDSAGAHRAFGCLLGAATVIPVGLLAARLSGFRAAVIAAVITATYPTLIQNDTVLMSEPLYALLVATSLLLAVRTLDRPSRGNAICLGVTLGLAALTRPEALLFAALLLLVTVTLSQKGKRLSLLAISAVCLALTISPWVVRNYLAFDQVVVTTSSGGGTLIGANCDSTYNGDLAGSWSFACLTKSSGHNDEFTEASIDRQHALDYIQDHSGDLPRIAVIRVLRTFGLYNPDSENRIGIFFEGRNGTVSWIALAYFYLVLLFALFGITRVRSDRRLLLLLVPIVMVVFISATVYGLTRFRVGADLSLIVFAALGISALSTRRAQAQEGTLDKVETGSGDNNRASKSGE